MNILLTLGRLAKGLELARSLHRAGHRVFIAEPFNLHLSKPSSAIRKSYQVTAPRTNLEQYLSELREIVEREQIDLVIPVSEEALYASRLSSRLSPKTRVFGPEFEQMARLHDKLAFARRCHSLGLSAPETYAANATEAESLSQRLDYVVKPIHSCSGIGLHLRQRGDVLHPADRAASNLIQERIYGRQISSFSIARNGQVLVTALYEGDVYLGTVSVRFKRIDDMPQVAQWIAAFVEAEAYSGFISFDFFVREDGTPFAIECNPRLTSGVHLINRADLAAMVCGETVDSPRFKRYRHYQDAHAALTYAVGEITRPLTYLKTLGKVLTTKDVMFDWRDPLPFFLMTPMSWDTLRQGMFEGVPLTDAVTRDILWQGDTPTITPDVKEVSLYGAGR